MLANNNTALKLQDMPFSVTAYISSFLTIRDILFVYLAFFSKKNLDSKEIAQAAQSALSSRLRLFKPVFFSTNGADQDAGKILNQQLKNMLCQVPFVLQRYALEAIRGARWEPRGSRLLASQQEYYGAAKAIVRYYEELPITPLHFAALLEHYALINEFCMQVIFASLKLFEKNTSTYNTFVVPIEVDLEPGEIDLEDLAEEITEVFLLRDNELFPREELGAGLTILAAYGYLDYLKYIQRMLSGCSILFDLDIQKCLAKCAARYGKVADFHVAWIDYTAYVNNISEVDVIAWLGAYAQTMSPHQTTQLLLNIKTKLIIDFATQVANSAAIGGQRSILSFILASPELSSEDKREIYLEIIAHLILNKHLKLLKHIAAIEEFYPFFIENPVLSRDIYLAVTTGYQAMIDWLLTFVREEAKISIVYLAIEVAAFFGHQHVINSLSQLLPAHRGQTLNTEFPFDDMLSKQIIDNAVAGGQLDSIQKYHPLIGASFWQVDIMQEYSLGDATFCLNYDAITTAVWNGHWKVVDFLILLFNDPAKEILDLSKIMLFTIQHLLSVRDNTRYFSSASIEIISKVQRVRQFFTLKPESTHYNAIREFIELHIQDEHVKAQLLDALPIVSNSLQVASEDAVQQSLSTGPRI